MNDRVDPVVEAYEQNGFAVFRNVLDGALIGEAREHVEWLQRRFPDLRPEHLHHTLMRDDAFWVRLVSDERLVAIARRMLGDDLACFTSHYICKPPGDGQAVLWHQDGAYWNLNPLEALTIWVAIDDCDPENGCLRMIPGSHRSELGPIVRRDDTPNMLWSSMDPALFDPSRAVDVPLRAGDVSIHHPRIVHGSDANRTSRRRCGLDIGYIQTSTRIGQTGLYLNPLLISGEARTGVNRYRAYPIFDPERTIPFRGAESWDEHALAQNRRPGVLPLPLVDEDVGVLTAHMIERLKSQNTKALAEAVR